MLDMGFLPQVKAIVRQLPAQRHTMFFSATLDGAVGTIAEEFTRDADRLRMRESASDTESLSERLDHNFLPCATADRVERLVELIGEEDDLVLVFCRTRRGAGKLAERLGKLGVPSEAMHGDLTQSAREKALRRFTRGTTRVLVATDVAARGIDLDDIGLVVNYDPPDDADAYTHRVGRTARAGRTGRAITLVSPDQADAMARLAVTLGLSEKWQGSGFALATPRQVYGSRRGRASAFSPAPRPSNARSAPESQAEAPKRNRVKRGSRLPTASG
jgi:superfamily II DNA/RNA helicase